MNRWSKRFAIGLVGLVLFMSLSVFPTIARDTPQFSILDSEPQQTEPSEPSVTPSPLAPGMRDPQEFAAFANEFFQQQLSQTKIPGAVISVVKDGEILFSNGYGYAELSSKTPVDPDRTLFRVASLSKLFTATSAMQLYEEGLLDIHQDVSPYLEDWELENPYSQPVTAAQLMMHVDGATQRLIGLAADTEAKMKPLEEYLPEHMPPIVYPPGKFYSYSNHSIALLGLLVAKISGLPFPEYVARNIFQPLEMNRSSFLQPPPPELENDLATGYQIQNSQPQPVPYLYLNIAPAAALSTTATDMAHFMLAHLQLGRYQNSRILTPETAREMHQTHYKIHPQLPGTSYGFRERLVNNKRAIGHLGSLRGYSSSLTLLPEENIGIFIAVNSFSNLHGEFLAKFFDRYFPSPTTFNPPESPELTQQQPARFVGTYRDMEYPRSTIAKLTGIFKHIRVVENNDTLRVTTPNLFFLRQFPGTDLFPTEQPRLFRRQDGSYVFFTESETGEITHVSNPLYPKIGTYQRVAWYETAKVQLGILAVCAILFVAVIFTDGIVPIFKALRGKSEQFSQLTAARKVALAIAILNLVFLIGLPLYLWLWGAWKLAYSVPIVVTIFFVLPILATILTVILLVLLVRVWQKTYWSWQRRTYYTLVTVAAIAFIPWLNYWNLLGFQF
ncbi:serine hydrolase domain-containing protein [Myxosarcina sp. GI1(2024)]